MAYINNLNYRITGNVYSHSLKIYLKWKWLVGLVTKSHWVLLRLHLAPLAWEYIHMYVHIIYECWVTYWLTSSGRAILTLSNTRGNNENDCFRNKSQFEYILSILYYMWTNMQEYSLGNCHLSITSIWLVVGGVFHVVDNDFILGFAPCASLFVDFPAFPKIFRRAK